MVELGNGKQEDFESRLAEALIEMRSQHELQIKMYKDDIEKTYTSKVAHPSDFEVEKESFMMCNVPASSIFRKLQANMHATI